MFMKSKFYLDFIVSRYKFSCIFSFIIQRKYMFHDACMKRVMCITTMIMIEFLFLYNDFQIITQGIEFFLQHHII